MCVGICCWDSVHKAWGSSRAWRVVVAWWLGICRPFRR